MAEHPASVVAVFVKTPGLSPVKTRLAATLGPAAADEFYALALAAVRSVLQEARSENVTVCWAVAEDEAVDHAVWSGFPRLPQGSGGLGERLERVYRQLKARADRVVFLGADSPQISVAELRAALETLTSPGPDFVLGRCPDGGFYLFGGRSEVPAAAWHETPWSTPETAQVFHRHLSRAGSVAELPHRSDVDVAEDLLRLADELALLSAPHAAQQQLLNWIINRPAQAEEHT